MKRDNNETKLCDKYGLTVDEASEYFGIGSNMIRTIVNSNPYEDFYMRIGKKVIIKRPLFEEFLKTVNEL